MFDQVFRSVSRLFSRYSRLWQGADPIIRVHRCWIEATVVVKARRHFRTLFLIRCPGENLNGSTSQNVAIISLGLGVFTDVLTAAAISWYLRKLKTGYKRSDTLVNKLIAYAVGFHIVTLKPHMSHIRQMLPDQYRVVD